MYRMTIRIALLICVGMAAVNSQPALGEEELIVLKALRAWPLEANDNAAYREFIAQVNKRGKGRVRVDDVGGTEIYPARQQLEVLRLGQVDLLYTVASYASTFPEPAILFYNFGATAPELRTGGMFKKLDEIGRRTNGVAFLGAPWFSSAHVYLKKPIEKLDELRTRKIRSNPGYDPLLKGLGIPTVSVPVADMFTALDRGVVDGMVWLTFDLTTYGFHKLVKYRVDPPFWRHCGVNLLANAKKLDGLPRDIQKLLLDTVMELEREAAKRYGAFAAKEAEQLKAAGVKSIKLSHADWLKTQRAAWEKGLPEAFLRASPKHGPELVQMMRQFYPPNKEYKTSSLD